MTAKPQIFEAASGHKIAYHQTEGQGPGVVFLGGFMSDMTGSKATHLEAWAKARGQAYLRFDYSGHGQSSEAFTDGCIGDWYDDALSLMEEVTRGPQILVGSSMGGWISLLIARSDHIPTAALFGIAAAPDFTQEGIWPSLDAQDRVTLARDGVVYVPSDYGDPYPITKKLIEDGRDHLIFPKPLKLDCPVRLFQGTEDTSVSTQTATRLLDHVEAEDARLMLVRGADHSFSDAVCLDILTKELDVILDTL
ncbi:MAG: alpha/beta hydrolase [Pseudomonadota bacterium]